MSTITLLATGLFFVSTVASAQRLCTCPKEDSSAVDKSFRFNSGRTIKLCGYKKMVDSEIVFSEFELKDCTSGKLVAKWGAVSQCQLEYVNDTLVVSELFFLPVGENFKYKLRPFQRHKFFATKKGISKTVFYDTGCIYYSKEQVRLSIDTFYRAKKENTENNIEIAERLFCSFVSGSIEAERCLKEVPVKLGPFDGAIAEQWNILWDLYLQYSKSLQTNR